ncbi:unnamed protein product, partial [Didymodactylos carnosus]
GNDLEIMGTFSDPQLIDPLKTEYEIVNLQPDTNYIIVVKLYNEAGVSEQKIRKQTTKARIDNIYSTIKSHMKNYRSDQPSKWAIVGIVFGIVFVALLVIVICVLIRMCRTDTRKTKGSD